MELLSWVGEHMLDVSLTGTNLMVFWSSYCLVDDQKKHNVRRGFHVIRALRIDVVRSERFAFAAFVRVRLDAETLHRFEHRLVQEAQTVCAECERRQAAQPAYTEEVWGMVSGVIDIN